MAASLEEEMNTVHTMNFQTAPDTDPEYQFNRFPLLTVQVSV